MALYKMMEPDFVNEDSRGRLVQVVHEGFSQINILTSLQNTVRGGHYHKERTEAFYVISGSVKVNFNRDAEAEERVFNVGDAFLVFPNVTHSMMFPEDCVLLQMYDLPVEYEDGTKDIFSVQ